MQTILEIERAIDNLTARQLEGLYAWLEQKHPHPMDSRLASDLALGRRDHAIQRALDDEAAGRLRRL